VSERDDTTTMREIRALRRHAPRRWPVRIGVAVFLCGCVASWFVMDLPMTHAVTGRSILRLAPGWYAELIPYPLRTADPGPGEDLARWNGSVFWEWAKAHAMGDGPASLCASIALSVLAVVAAGIFGALFVLPASRHVLRNREARLARRGGRYLLFGSTRALLLIARAIPEYIWAFLFLLLCGPVMLVGVLALAIHHAGILGKLGSEQAEDMDQKGVRALRSLGAGDTSVMLFGVWPRILPQFLVYFFYSWETCLREAAILGILGLHTLGFHIYHSFAVFRYDDALLYIAMNSVVVIAGDLLSSWGRRRVRLVGRR
jgi:ABC-type phosphate/phosphonate transport system permease subunit